MGHDPAPWIPGEVGRSTQKINGHFASHWPLTLPDPYVN
jgi:hypothetical protein